MTRKLHPTRNDLPANVREQMVNLLNQNTFDAFDLYSQVKHAHWNVKGRDFFQLHELFDALAAKLLGHIDTMAERATALGGTATGTVRATAAASRIPEFPTDVFEGMRQVEALSDRYARLAANTHSAIDEAN